MSHLNTGRVIQSPVQTDALFALPSRAAVIAYLIGLPMLFGVIAIGYTFLRIYRDWRERQQRQINRALYLEIEMPSLPERSLGLRREKAILEIQREHLVLEEVENAGIPPDEVKMVTEGGSRLLQIL